MSVAASNIPDRFELTDADKLNPLWVRLEKHFQNRLTVLRMQNDGDLSDVETGRLRGQIKEVKAILALAKDRPVID